MKKWLLAFAIAFPAGLGTLFGIGCAVHANFCGGNPSAGITDGARLYEINCAKCHGPNGEGGRAGDIAVPPLRTGNAASMTFEQLVQKISKGRPFKGMPAFALGPGHLTRQQIESLARYLIALRGTS
jgi:mono/diheme cytochrome c family protein